MIRNVDATSAERTMMCSRNKNISLFFFNLKLLKIVTSEVIEIIDQTIEFLFRGFGRAD